MCMSTSGYLNANARNSIPSPVTKSAVTEKKFISNNCSNVLETITLYNRNLCPRVPVLNDMSWRCF